LQRLGFSICFAVSLCSRLELSSDIMICLLAHSNGMPNLKKAELSVTSVFSINIKSLSVRTYFLLNFPYVFKSFEQGFESEDRIKHKLDI
jgi:hypothetical protein